ncbi:unnamed protein product [Prorocentrum cordatum]|uniref:Cytochrome b561 domain-containing protein n=1 Tax=Prorocentrum cordatum TaxID=2364126 RepID=A0ABN9WP41_9DINO|nr:unnamed protein product [Polarella glacialis]
MAVGLDAVVTMCAVGVTITVCLGMWSSKMGTGLAMTVPFSWHPVLMTLGYASLMTLGRWAYLADPSEKLGTADLQGRRIVHRACMTLACMAALSGYAAIFYAHWPSRQYFGYGFVKGQWSEWRRVAHVYIGYTLLVLVAAQAHMGFQKYRTLQNGGPRIFTFHGYLGKGILVLSTAEILLATWFWAWGARMKAAVAVLAVACGLFGACAPRPLPEKAASDWSSLKNETEIAPAVVGGAV